MKMASRSCDASVRRAMIVHFLCCSGLAAAFGVSHILYSSTLVTNPVQTLLILWVVECPIVILGYSFFRQDQEKCSYWQATRRSILGIPVGALLNASGAVILGAPVGIQHLAKTVHWSLLMSLFTVVPAASVFGTSWEDWQRLFAYTEFTGFVDYLISLPAHGAVIGAWFGAWPMPLDWERPWQEWPICVSYGSIMGYLVGLLASFAFVLVSSRRKHIKAE